MPYARVDDRYHDTRKVKRALRRSPAAIAVHIMAITYCNMHVTDGDIEAFVVEEWIAATPYSAKQKREILPTLFDLNLLERKDSELLHVHDFHDWNLSKAQRQALAEQGRRGGQRGGPRSQLTGSEGSSSGLSEGLSEGSSEGPSHSDRAGLSPPTPTPTPTPKKDITSDASGADPHPDDQLLCRLLTELAKERNPKFKVRSPAKWLADMRLLRERDGNSRDEIERAIRWVFRHSFWGGVIQSPAGLREHFPQIWDQMGKPNGNGKENASDLLGRLRHNREQSLTAIEGSAA